MKKIPKDIKEKVQGATELVLEDKQEVDMYSIKRVLEEVYGVKFFNEAVLQVLVNQALENIVYICF